MKLDSTFPDFPGHVIIPDRFIWPQLLAFGKAVAANHTNVITRPSISHLEICENSITAVNMIVEWHIEGLPKKPTQADIFEDKDTIIASAFYMFVYKAVERAWRQEKQVPKALSSEPTNTLPTRKQKTKTAAKNTPTQTN